MYDYEGDCEDDLALEEGQIIRILSRKAHGVDDGWWRGESNGAVGNFPSLIVDICDEFGEPISEPDEWSLRGSAPSVFVTPPDSPLPDDDDVLETNAAPPANPPPPPPPDFSDSMDSQPDLSFNLELNSHQYSQYDAQFDNQVAGPSAVTIVVDEVYDEDDDDDEDEEVLRLEAPVPAEAEVDCGLGVAQIVITAATPMIEEPDQPFPPPEPQLEQEVEPENENEDEESSLSEQTAVCLRDDDGPPHADPYPARSSIGSDESGASVASGPPTAPESPPAAPRAGRASIPDELEPAQLARLTDLKESNA